MTTTKHLRDGAINIIKDGVFLGVIGYTNSNSSVGVVSQDEAVDYLVSDGYNRKYANRVLSTAFNRGVAGRIGRGLYVLKDLSD